MYYGHFFTIKFDIKQAAYARYAGSFFKLNLKSNEIHRWIRHCILRLYVSWRIYFPIAENEINAIAVLYFLMRWETFERLILVDQLDLFKKWSLWQMVSNITGIFSICSTTEIKVIRMIAEIVYSIEIMVRLSFVSAWIPVFSALGTPHVVLVV